MANVSLVLSLVMIPAAIRKSAAVESVERHNWQGMPCAGLQNELTRHRNVVACKARWQGHIATGANEICQGEWEVCNQEYYRVLREISWYEASHIAGCYAVNASHGSNGCVSCGEETEMYLPDMAAIGADCPKYERSRTSCFGEGTIYASDSRLVDYAPCQHVPWITGVLCCRKGSQHPQVRVYAEVTPSRALLTGMKFKLQCHVSDADAVRLHWYHNGSYIEVFDDQAVVSINATIGDSGTWKCEAIYGYGKSQSRPLFIRVVKWDSDAKVYGCRNKSSGKMLASTYGKVALCRGDWNGHVKSASSKLCAKGWKVCTNNDRPSLYTILWQEVAKIEGCFAYDAASTKYYPCAKCSPRNTGNRMSGIGSGCENLHSSGYSCLGKGRMDVFSSEKRNGEQKNFRSCRHQEGITTGVACCKKLKKRKEKVRCKCRNGGKCSLSGKCKCPSGFRGKRCHKRVSQPQRRNEV